MPKVDANYSIFIVFGILILAAVLVIIFLAKKGPGGGTKETEPWVKIKEYRSIQQVQAGIIEEGEQNGFLFKGITSYTDNAGICFMVIYEQQL